MKQVAIAVLALGSIMFTGCKKEQDAPGEQKPAVREEQQPTQDTASAGKPRFVITVEEDSARRIRGGACVNGSRVDVHAEIGGGRAPNSLSGDADCGTTRVVTGRRIFDPGNGTAVRTQDQGTQVPGQASCIKNAVQGNPKSRITVVCYFY